MGDTRGSKLLRKLGICPPQHTSQQARQSLKSARRALFEESKVNSVLTFPTESFKKPCENSIHVEILPDIHMHTPGAATVLATQHEDHVEISPELSRIRWESESNDPPSPVRSNVTDEIDIEALSEAEDDREFGRNKITEVIPDCARFLTVQEVALLIKKQKEMQKEVTPHKLTKTAKRNCCPFCLKLETNFSRHLIKYHKDEEEVKAYLSILDDNLKERKRKRTAITEELRKKGNHKYNLKVVNEVIEGELIPMRRPVFEKYDVTTKTHAACTYCLGLFKKENLYLHLRGCPKKELSEKTQDNSDQRTRANKSAGIMLIPEKVLVLATKSLRENVFKSMQGPLAVVAQSDPLIVEFGARYHNTHRDSNQVNYRSQRMRDLARVYEAMKEKCEGIDSFEDCLKPNKFDQLMEVVRDLGDFDEDTGYMGVPSIAPRLCSHLKTCADIIKSKLIKDSNQITPEKNPKIKKIDHFLHLMSSEWNTEVGGNAEKTRKKKAAEKESILPDDEDIRCMSINITNKYDKLVETLKIKPSVESYEEVVKLLITHIIVLSRRRPAEVCKATLDQYKKLDHNKSLSKRFSSILTKEQQRSENILSIFHVVGKNGKTVPILLTEKMKEAADCLVESRVALKINSRLLFARPNSKFIYNGTAIMNEMKKKLKLKNPDHFTATGLRHHAATSTQLHNRDDTYTENLATFMGHDLTIHKKNYRLPLPVIQKAHVGHRLLEMTLPATSTSNESERELEVDSHNNENHFPSLEEQLPSYDSENQPLQTSESESEPPSPKKRKVVKRRRWTDDEKESIYQHFAQNISHNMAPERKEIINLLKDEPALRNRTIDQVVTYVNNIFTGKTKIPTPVINRLRHNSQ